MTLKSPKTCFGLNDCAALLRPAYHRLALVTCWAHIAELDINDTDTLLVTSNWLLWQQCLDKGYHCLHTDFSLEDLADTDLNKTLFIRSNDWLLNDSSDDVSLFHDVSLGRKFSKELSIIIAEFVKASHALESLCTKFGPKELVLFEYRTPDGMLGSDSCKEIVLDVARRQGIAIIDKSTPSSMSLPDFPSKKGHMKPQPTSFSFKGALQNMFRRSFSFCFCALGRIYLRFGRKHPRVLFLNSQLTSIPLITEFSGGKLTPLLLSEWFPNKKDVRFLLKSVLKGIVLIGVSRPSLSKADLERLDAIERRIKERLTASITAIDKFCARYILENILKENGLIKSAERALWAESIIDTYRPDHIFTDSLQNPMIHTFLEIAQKRAISTSVTWHSHWIQEQRLEIFGCDPRITPMVDRCFTWGKTNESWLSSIGAKNSHHRTGNILITKLLDQSVINNTNDQTVGKKALVLEYTAQYEDFSTKAFDEYAFFVEAVRMLSDLGYTEIRFKVHPNNPNTPYYEAIAVFFDLRCEIVELGPFSKHIEWADFAIGPVSSGATVEFIASGKPYFPMILDARPVNMNYFEGGVVYSDLQAVRAQLETGCAQSQNQMLENITSYSTIRNPAEQTWRALEKFTGQRALLEH